MPTFLCAYHLNSFLQLLGDVLDSVTPINYIIGPPKFVWVGWC